MLTLDAIANRNLHFANADARYLAMEPIAKQTQRLGRLRAEIDAAGGPKAFVEKYMLKRDPSYFSQVIHGHRTFGERAAANLEKECGWPPGHLEKEEPANDDVFMMIREFPPTLRASLEEHIRELYASLKHLPTKR